MEGQHFLGVANTALPSNLHLENQQQALRLQQKVSQLKVHLASLSPCPPLNLPYASLLHAMAHSKLCHDCLAAQAFMGVLCRD